MEKQSYIHQEIGSKALILVSSSTGRALSYGMRRFFTNQTMSPKNANMKP